jgi:hypothetical protein
VPIAFDFVVVMERTPGPAGLDRSGSEAAASASWSSGTASVAAATGMFWFLVVGFGLTLHCSACILCAGVGHAALRV